MAEKFCLKWNDFQSNASNAFSLLRNEDYLHDVTIVTDDSEQIAAHKLVLSACSEYFKSIFRKNKHSHPLLCLEGVSSSDVRNVMDYIYNGEVKIFQEELDRFLNVAQRLKLEGLLTDLDAEHEEEVNAGETEIFKKQEKQYTHEDSTKEKTKTIPNKIEKFNEKVIAKANTDLNQKTFLEVNDQIEQNISRNLDGTYSCQICGKKSRTTQHIKNHIETHVVGLTYNCPMCEKTFRSRPSLGMHKSKFHKNVSILGRGML